MRPPPHLAAVAAVALAAGCQSCDRPRLLDRLFHRDDDCPSARAAGRAALDPACAPVGAAVPVSFTPGVVYGDLGTAVPDAGYAQPSAANANELPQPQRITPPATPVPTDGRGLGR